MRRGIRIARRIVRQSPFDAYRGTELRPGSSVDSDRGLDAFIQQYAESAYHRVVLVAWVSTKELLLINVVWSMGCPLRIVDASIMPEITNGNLNAVVIMMAEKISELIRQSN